MGRVVLALLLVGCNSIYGLEATQLPPQDAPIECPAIGEDIAFSSFVEQVIFRDCSYAVSPSGLRAILGCDDSLAFQEGPADSSDVVEAAGLPLRTIPSATQTLVYVGPVLFADDRLGLPEITIDAQTGMVSRQRVLEFRKAAGAWTSVGVLPFGDTFPESVSTVASTTEGTMVMTTRADGLVREYVEDGAGWRLARTSAIGAFSGASRISVSRDGLRVFAFTSRPLYTDRASLDAPFREPVSVVAPPVTSSMTSDCARLYFSGLERVFTVRRR